MGTQSDKVARLLPEGDAARFGIFAKVRVMAQSLPDAPIAGTNHRDQNPDDHGCRFRNGRIISRSRRRIVATAVPIVATAVPIVTITWGPRAGERSVARERASEWIIVIRESSCEDRCKKGGGSYALKSTVASPAAAAWARGLRGRGACG